MNSTHPELANGVFFHFPQAVDDVLLSYLFRMSALPLRETEVCDLYSAEPDRQEIFDVYINAKGQLLSYHPGLGNRWIADPIPVNTTVRVWERWNRTGHHSIAWSLNGEPEPVDGGRFAQGTGTPTYNYPAVELLFGPIVSDTIFYYDDVQIVSPAPFPGGAPPPRPPKCHGRKCR